MLSTATPDIPSSSKNVNRIVTVQPVFPNYLYVFYDYSLVYFITSTYRKYNGVQRFIGSIIKYKAKISAGLEWGKLVSMIAFFIQMYLYAKKPKHFV